MKRNLKVYLEDYKRGRSILTLAKQANYPPYLFCRYIVEQVANIPNGKRGLTQAMRDPMEELKSLDIIKDPYLEAEEKMSEDLR